MKKKQFLLAFAFLLLIGAQISCQKNPKEDYHILIPGVGYDNYKIGVTTLEDIIKTNGNSYRLDTFYRKTDKNSPDYVNEKGEIYSIAACYDSLGVRFFFYPNEKNIFSIVLRPPFKGITKEGIKLNESNFNDLVKCYGDSPWGFGPGRMSMGYGGIWFTQKSNYTFESTDKEKNTCLYNKITEITIANPD